MNSFLNKAAERTPYGETYRVDVLDVDGRWYAHQRCDSIGEARRVEAEIEAGGEQARVRCIG